MKKEIYRVKRPGYIVFGNSEDYGKREHRGHIVDYSPANCFSAGVILTENGSDQNPVCSMSICFAREDLLSRIMGEDTPSECVYEMETFPQTRKFLLEIDGEWDEIENDGSGSCCEFKKLFHITKQGKFCDGAILSIKLPEKTDFSSMKQMAKYYFQNMRLASGTDNGHNAKITDGFVFWLGKEISMGEFWETIMGKYFYEKQFPALIESVNRLAKSNEELNESIREQNRLLKMELEQSNKLD